MTSKVKGRDRKIKRDKRASRPLPRKGIPEWSRPMMLKNIIRNIIRDEVPTPRYSTTMASYPYSLEPAGLPVSNYLPSFWLSEPSRLERHRTTDKLPQTADIVIVGSGLSGSLLAYKLLKGNPKLSIVILEAREVCTGATARNGGQVKTDPYIIYRAHKAKYGAKLADELLRFETGHLARFEELLASEPIECSFHVTTAYDVCMTEPMAANARASYLERTNDWPESKRMLRELDDPEELERLSQVKGGLWGCMYRVASIWPYKLATGLLERCFELAAEAGGSFNLQTTTPVTSLTHDGESWCVCTHRGVIKAPRVVTCTNGYTSNILPDMANKVVPVRGTASSLNIPAPQPTSTPSSKVMRQLFTSYAIKFGAGRGDYMICRQEADKRVILGGAKQGYIEDPKNWYGSVDDSELLPGAVDYFTEYMTKHFVNWPDATSNVDRVWTGILGYSSDLVPWIGQHVAQPDGLFVMAGFHGHGMSRIFGSAVALSELLLSGKTGSEGLEVLQAAGLPTPYLFTKERYESDKNVILTSMGYQKHPAPDINEDMAKVSI